MQDILNKSHPVSRSKESRGKNLKKMFDAF